MVVGEMSMVETPVAVNESFVRKVPESYPRCLKRPGRRVMIDVEKAREQHAGYVAALRSLGIEVTVLESNPTCPDSPFVEDRAVFCGPRHVIVTRSAVGSRSFEEAGLIDVLDERFLVHQMPPDATLDGGDVLQVESEIFVGHSERTNAAGIRFLENVASLAGFSVEAVEVRGALHLKSVCSPLGGRQLLVEAGKVPVTAMPTLEHIKTPGDANVLAVRNGLIVATESTATRRVLEQCGKTVLPVPLSEFLKGNGGPTCLSLRVPV